MTKLGKDLLQAAKEARAIALGEKPLVERLRMAPYTEEDTMGEWEWVQISFDAADEIERLQAENAKLKAAK